MPKYRTLVLEGQYSNDSSYRSDNQSKGSVTAHLRTPLLKEDINVRTNYYKIFIGKIYGKKKNALQQI